MAHADLVTEGRNRDQTRRFDRHRRRQDNDLGWNDVDPQRLNPHRCPLYHDRPPLDVERIVPPPFGRGGGASVV